MSERTVNATVSMPRSVRPRCYVCGRERERVVTYSKTTANQVSSARISDSSSFNLCADCLVQGVEVFFGIYDANYRVHREENDSDEVED